MPTATDASRALATALRAHGFTYTGPTGMFALMEATGMTDTHLADCHRRGTHTPTRPTEPTTTNQHRRPQYSEPTR
ncbi:DNA-3-methyladenine glycosylase I [Kitasatospora cineracea]|uniref:DNA-3-methyladenine glycosylase I n=1 Tax=Kitasatospora cineracea TaxID=88074 RepID=UPI00344445DF